ncbi:uncharacterized protein BDW43DRAFT_199495 [Aspergillus alliaceus]|uniref:uncharacterized protein n=1 Tax=Petromyces alliaceus TaxID=209559 RepID=UPI0012A77467|nr:uncharacterized protein BDW43DRAFT_199495 [Aspergillus alliaceus]KAB8228941.1 hypothetical protein BDW43DRAFT_199495 [Aspergillus alliaceus]
MRTDGAEVLPPLLSITQDNHGAIVITASSILLIVAALATIVTLISRVRILGALTWGDTFLVAAMIMFIPQTTCIIVAGSDGIGKHRDSLSDTAFKSYSQLLYASQILSAPVLGCSKAAVALLLISIKPFNIVLQACRILLGLIGAWTVVAVVALALQCTQPQAWNFSSGRCLNQQALYSSLAACHIILDAALIILPIVLVWKVQMPEWKRFQICALFGLRILVPALTVPYIASLDPFFHSKPKDQPWHALMPTIWLQLMQSTSIICTCIPSLKRALAELQTGMMAGTIPEFLELSLSGRHDNTTDASTSKPGNRSLHPIGGSELYSDKDTKRRLKEQRHHGFRNTTVEPQESMLNLRNGAIIQTMEYEVQYEWSSEHSRASSTLPGHVNVPWRWLASPTD